MWTIPIEYRASLLLFLVQIAVCRFRPVARMSITVLLMLFSLYVDHFEMILFLGGFFFAQLEPSLCILEHRWGHNRPVWTLYIIFTILVLVTGLHLASTPMWQPNATPGYIWLSAHIPSCFVREPVWFWPSVGSLLIVHAIGRLQSIQNILTSPKVQYLGQISFSIYLLHYFTEVVVGTEVLYDFGRATSNLDRHNIALFWLGQGITLSCILVLVVWLGDIWCRFVDTPSVTLAKWVETSLLVRKLL